MGIWLAIVAVWGAYGAAGAVRDVGLPWLVTIGCWACVDLVWHRSTRGDAPLGGGVIVPIRLRVLTKIPYLLYGLPLGDVPILGQRFLPASPSLQWAGAAMCVGGVGLGIYARSVLAKSWSGDVAITPAHALVRRGPYAVVRHPIYLGLLVAQLGMILALGEVRALISMYGIERLLKKLPQEEAALRAAYPTEYDRYARHVWKLVPFVW